MHCLKIELIWCSKVVTINLDALKSEAWWKFEMMSAHLNLLIVTALQMDASTISQHSLIILVFAIIQTFKVSKHLTSNWALWGGLSHHCDLWCNFFLGRIWDATLFERILIHCQHIQEINAWFSRFNAKLTIIFMRFLLGNLVLLLLSRLCQMVKCQCLSQSCCVIPSPWLLNT